MNCRNFFCALCDLSLNSCKVSGIECCKQRANFEDLLKAVNSVGASVTGEALSGIAARDPETAYVVKSRYYAKADNFGESYVIEGDNGGKDTKLEPGEKIIIRKKAE